MDFRLLTLDLRLATLAKPTSTVTSADAIYLVNCVFKGGPHPRPFFECGDADCSGSITSADIIHIVGYVFKGDDAPCDVCAVP